MDDMMKNGGGMTCGSCGCMHHKFVPILIILFGLTFLLEAYGMLGAATVGIVWPILVILTGILKLTSGKCKCC